MAGSPTVEGLAVAALLADATVAGLVVAEVYAGEVPSEFPVPFVVLRDEEEKPAWQHQKARTETHRVRCRSYAASGSVAGEDNPAEAIANACERVLDFNDIVAQIAGAVPLVLLFEDRTRFVSQYPSKLGERVYVVELTWRVVFQRTLT